MERVFLITLFTFVGIASPGQSQATLEKKTYAVDRHAANTDQLLMDMERDWAKAIVTRDATRIREILAPEIVLTAPDGNVLNREDDIAELLAGEFTAESYDAVDMNVRVYGDCAVVTGVTNLKGKYKGAEIQEQFRWTDTFVKRSGRWQVVASQATSIQKRK